MAARTTRCRLSGPRRPAGTGSGVVSITSISRRLSLLTVRSVHMVDEYAVSPRGEIAISWRRLQHKPQGIPAANHLARPQIVPPHGAPRLRGRERRGSNYGHKRGAT